MLTQQEYDIANIEAEVEIQELIGEWFRDYLGARGIENGDYTGLGNGREQGGAAGASIQAPAGPEVPNQS
jgi:hypothetical protein